MKSISILNPNLTGNRIYEKIWGPKLWPNRDLPIGQLWSNFKFFVTIYKQNPRNPCCGPFWPYGHIGQSAQNSPILNFLNKFCTKSKFKKGSILLKNTRQKYVGPHIHVHFEN